MTDPTPPRDADPARRVPDITVVIPVYNEASYIPEALPAILAQVETVPGTVEVIIAENGSTDGTAEAAAEAGAGYPHLRVLRLPEPDYGAAMRAGFAAGRGEWRVNFDIDYFSGSFLAEVLAVAGDADLVLASKRAAGADDRRSALRRLATLVFNLILRVLFRSKVSDTHGIKAVRAEVVDRLLPVVASTKDLFDTELVLRAERAGYRIVEVPALVEELRDTDQGLLRRVPRTLAGLGRLRWRLWREP